MLQNRVDSLHLTTFGGLQIVIDGAAAERFRSRKAEALLVFLAVQAAQSAAFVPREVAATLLWGDIPQTRALANLSVALTSLRKQLDPWLEITHRDLRLRPEQLDGIDVYRFERLLTTARDRQQAAGRLTRTAAASLREAVALYQGDFLAGFSVRNAPEFESWVLLQQQRLRQQMQRALDMLVEYGQTRSDLTLAEQYAARRVALDPLDEPAVRRQMALLLRLGRAEAALRVFERCRETLAAELGVAPDPATLAAAAAAEKGVGAGSVPTPPAQAEHNLPQAATLFVGRSAELQQIAAQLDDETCRLLTLIGIGGAGKTRLALEAARRQIGRFSDGVRWLPLATLPSTAAVADRLAAMLGLTLSGRRPAADQLADRLRDREMLLLLDNADHLLSAELNLLLTTLLAAAPELRLLITSRARLNLQSEWLMQIDGLPTDVQAQSLSPAADLFVARARQVRADFTLTQATQPAVAQICALTGGLPLALELAATWVRALSVDEIAAELTAGLGILAAGYDDLPPRHRNMRAVFDYSWRSLSAEAQRLFRQAAILRGGFTLATARAIVGASPPVLAELIDQSLITRERNGRYTRHPLLWQYAHELLLADPVEHADVQRRHTQTFAALLAEAEAPFVGSQADRLLDELAPDEANFEAAWHAALAADDWQSVRQMWRVFSGLFYERSRFAAGSDLCTQALDALAAQLPHNADLYARLAAQAAKFALRQGDYATAKSLLKRALPHAAADRWPLARADLLENLGYAESNTGNFDTARDYLHEAERLARRGDEPPLLCTILNSLAYHWMHTGDYEQAAACFDEALALAEQIGNRARLQSLYNGFGILAARRERYGEARQWYERFLAEARARRHTWAIAVGEINLGLALNHLGRYAEARQQIEQSLARYRTLGDRGGIMGCLGSLGLVSFNLGQWEAAERYHRAALREALAIGARATALCIVVEFGRIALQHGDALRAAELLALAAAEAATPSSCRDMADNLLNELRAELPALDQAAAQSAKSAERLFAQLTAA